MYCYRFGFNGQMKDNEVYGEGNSYTAEYWQYDPRLGRRWNIDPKPQISISDYATFRNSPILYNDVKGDKPECESCKTEEDWKLYYSQVASTMEMYGYDMMSGFPEGPFSSSVDEEGHTTYYQNGVRMDLDQSNLGGKILNLMPPVVSVAPSSNTLKAVIIKPGRSFLGLLKSSWSSAKTWFKGNFTRINFKGIDKIEKHIAKMDWDAANDVMIQRLKDIAGGKAKPTKIDKNYYLHELGELKKMQKGLSYEDAHIQTLKEFGIKYEKGFEKFLYTDDALKAGDDAYKNSAKYK